MTNLMQMIIKRRQRRQLILQHLIQTAQQAASAASEACAVEMSRRNAGRSTCRKWRGRLAGAKNIERGESSWITDYLVDVPLYSKATFRARFGVPLALFWRIHDALVQFKPEFWDTRLDARKKKGKDSRIKVLVCLRILRYGRGYDDMDDSARMGKETIRSYFRAFCVDMAELYGNVFLNRRPTQEELRRIEKEYRRSGFPGCAGAVDCMKLHWKNCPSALKGQFHNSKEGKLATIVVEAWCDTHLYVWHWYAGRAGTNNDKTLVAYSPLFSDIRTGKFKLQMGGDYRVRRGGMTRSQMYFLVDGIYYPWPMFAKPIHHPTSHAESRYTKKQEGRRKDIERCFGVLQSRFHILRRESNRWDRDEVVRVSEACVIIHNILICMCKRGAFDDEVGAGEDAVSIIAELYEEEAENMAQSTAERQETVQDADNDVLEDVVAEAERRFILDSIMTNQGMHQDLQEDLMKSFQEHGGEQELSE